MQSALLLSNGDGVQCAQIAEELININDWPTINSLMGHFREHYQSDALERIEGLPWCSGCGNPLSNTGDVGSIPGQGLQIPHAASN